MMNRNTPNNEANPYLVKVYNGLSIILALSSLQALHCRPDKNLRKCKKPRNDLILSTLSISSHVGFQKSLSFQRRFISYL